MSYNPEQEGLYYPDGSYKSREQIIQDNKTNNWSNLFNLNHNILQADHYIALWILLMVMVEVSCCYLRVE